MKYCSSQGIQCLFKVLGAYKNRWLFVTKETSRTKSPPSNAWEGGRETDNGQTEKLKYLGFSSPTFKVGTHQKSLTMKPYV